MLFTSSVSSQPDATGLGPVEHCCPHKGWSVLGDQYTEATFCITANLSVSPRNIQFDSNAFGLWQSQLR